MIVTNFVCKTFFKCKKSENCRVPNILWDKTHTVGDWRSGSQDFEQGGSAQQQQP